MGNRTPGIPSGPPRRSVTPPKKKIFGAAMDARRIEEADRSPRIVSSFAMSSLAFFVRLLLFGIVAALVQLGYQMYVKAYQGGWFTFSALDFLALLRVDIPPEQWVYPFLGACSPGVAIASVAFLGCIISQLFMRRA